jgi:cytidine deaminase
MREVRLDVLFSRREALVMLAGACPAGRLMGKRSDSAAKAWLDAQDLRRLVPSFSVPSRERLLRSLNNRALRGQLPAAEVEGIAQAEGKQVEALMVDLLPVAQLYAQPPISSYRVGAVARGASGSLYWGANLEVPHQPLGHCVHAEQAAVANAFLHDEAGLVALAINAAPCGHCRQFLNELPNAPDLTVLVANHPPTTLAALLPAAFGPSNLGTRERLFGGKSFDLELAPSPEEDLTRAALKAACQSYAPYSRSPSGVALRSLAGHTYAGSYIENAAFNPSLPPLQAALVSLIMGGEEPGDITAAVLVEVEDAPISQASAARDALGALAPAVTLRRVPARWQR